MRVKRHGIARTFRTTFLMSNDEKSGSSPSSGSDWFRDMWLGGEGSGLVPMQPRRPVVLDFESSQSNSGNGSGNDERSGSNGGSNGDSGGDRPPA